MINKYDKKYLNITIIGPGQIGELFIKQASLSKLKISVIGRDQQKLSQLSKKYPNINFSNKYINIIPKSEVIFITAGSEGTKDILNQIQKIKHNNPIIIITQNGLFTYKKNQLTKLNNLIRASVFTVVTTNKQNEVIYDPQNLKISLSTIRGQGLKKVKTIITKMGFISEIINSWENMQITKLMLNTIGSTSVITGLTISQTFKNPNLFDIEIKAIRDRMKIIKANKYHLYNFKQINIPAKTLMNFLILIPMPVLKMLRLKLGTLIVKKRKNQLSAASKKINKGILPAEINDYHKKFLQLAQKHKLKSPIDQTIINIANKHYKDLKNMSKKQRLTLLKRMIKI